jgi:hypothetical protein
MLKNSFGAFSEQIDFMLNEAPAQGIEMESPHRMP